MTPSPDPQHQLISRNIAFDIYLFVRKRNLGEVLYSPIDVYFSDTETYQPDVIFISKERLHIIGKKKIEGAPDLVIEVLSPSTAKYDIKNKKDVYELNGVKEYWIVDPVKKSISVFENTSYGFEVFQTVYLNDTVHSNILKGYSISLNEVFNLF